MIKTKTLFGISGLFFVLVLTACGVETIKGSGNVIREDRRVSNFSEIEFEGFGEVIITQGDDEALSIEADDNLLEYIQTQVTDKTLRITFTRNKNLIPSSSIIFQIRLKNLTAIGSSGAGFFRINRLITDNLEITSSGAAKIKINSLSAKDLSVITSGAGDVELSGKVEVQNIEMSGVGNFTAPNLESQETVIDISGIGNAVIWAVEILEVDINGNGDVSYFGSPEVDYKDSGFGDLKSLGDK